MKIITLLTLISFPLMAQDFTFDKEKGRAVPTYIGQLKLIKGKVFKKSGENVEEVQVGARFGKADTLITQEGSFARILIVDETVLSVGPKSELQFSEFDFVDKNNRKAVFNFIKGQLGGQIKNKAKPGDITFRTKLTTIGVRGTDLFLNHQTVKNLEITEHALSSGKTVVSDEKGAEKEIEKGERIVIIKDSQSARAASEKIKLSGTELETLMARGLDEEKEPRPLLPYFKVATINSSSSLYKVISEEEPTGTSDAPAKREEVKKDWRQNLEKLNEKLKENQRKR